MRRLLLALAVLALVGCERRDPPTGAERTCTDLGAQSRRGASFKPWTYDVTPETYARWRWADSVFKADC